MSAVVATIKYYPETDDPESSSAGISASAAGSGTSSGASTGASFVANCDPSLVVGQVVRLSADNSGTYTAYPVDITQLDQAPATGIIDKKYSNVLCSVTERGAVSGVFSGLTANKSYWVSPSGIPAALPLGSLPGGACYQRVGVALSGSILDVNIGADIVKTSS